MSISKMSFLALAASTTASADGLSTTVVVNGTTMAWANGLSATMDESDRPSWYAASAECGAWPACATAGPGDQPLYCCAENRMDCDRVAVNGTDDQQTLALKCTLNTCGDWPRCASAGPDGKPLYCCDDLSCDKAGKDENGNPIPLQCTEHDDECDEPELPENHCAADGLWPRCNDKGTAEDGTKIPLSCCFAKDEDEGCDKSGRDEDGNKIPLACAADGMRSL